MVYQAAGMDSSPRISVDLHGAVNFTEGRWLERRLAGSGLPASDVSDFLHEVNPLADTGDRSGPVISPRVNSQRAASMNMSPEIEPGSTERLLACLGLAIDEARLVRSIIESREIAQNLKTEKTFSERLVELNREISSLEARLAEVRRRASPGRHV
jgi:hypothetical protein